MIYDLKKLSVAYVRGFKNYIKEADLTDWSNEQQYNLFSYALCRLYFLESAYYSKGTSRYGRSCEKYLRELKHTPKHKDKISFADRVSLLSLSQAYFVSEFIAKGMREVVVNGSQESL